MKAVVLGFTEFGVRAHASKLVITNGCIHFVFADDNEKVSVIDSLLNYGVNFELDPNYGKTNKWHILFYLCDVESISVLDD